MRHRDEGLIVPVGHFVHSRHVRVVERAGCLRFPLESRAGVMILRGGRRQELEGDPAMQADILGQVDAHASGAHG